MSDTRPPTPDEERAVHHAPTPPAEDRGEAEVKRRRVAAQPVTPGRGPKAAKQSMADLLVGTVLSERYRLVEKMGEGAMGWVFLAEHVDIRKKFAVKVLRPSLCRLNEAVSRFKREARAATSIGSLHIVDVTDFGQTSTGAAYFVMEYLDGEDLASTLAREKRLPWPRVQKMMLQLCDALQAAHDVGITHRDVKPANFYRVNRSENEDFMKVLDFGIARLANPTDSIVTQTGVVMGTPDFMAPEQAQGRKVDHRVDIYSLGASAYALLTGKPPFVGKNEYDVIYKQLNEEPKSPGSQVPDLPAWADEAILKAMRKNPDERYQTMREFAEALQGPQVDESAAASQPSAASRSGSASLERSGSRSGVRSAERSGPGNAPAKSGGLSPAVIGIGLALLAVIGFLAFIALAK